jgi:hypothetical protein
MTSYITASNQEMLWRTIQKNVLFGQTLTLEQQPVWFREIIGNFYSETANKSLNGNELLELNKNTLRYMVHKLKEHTSHQAIDEPINDRLQPQSSSYLGDYDKLQTNYNNMHQRDVPQAPNFKEEIDDGKITNMDELLQQQLKDRELETPKPPIQLMSTATNPLQLQSETPKPPPQLMSTATNSVQSQSETTNVKIETTNNDISELKNLFKTLLNRMDELEREMNVMRSQLIHQPNNDENLTL